MAFTRAKKEVQCTLFGEDSIIDRIEHPPYEKVYKPMLAKVTPYIDPFTDYPDDGYFIGDHVLQEKFDGCRVIAIKDGDGLYMMSRTWINNYTGKYPSIAKDLAAIPYNYIIDGELMFFDKKTGLPVYHTSNATEEFIQAHDVKYMVFDMMEYNGTNLANTSFINRCEAIKNNIVETDNIKIVKTYDVVENYKTVYETIIQNAGEGVILKNKNAPYKFNKRDIAWSKVKKVQDEDCVIMGITYGTGKRSDTMGALILGQYTKYNKLRYVGSCSGFTDSELDMIYNKIMDMPETPRYFGGKLGDNKIKRIVNPEIVVAVKCMEKTQYGVMRLPVFLHIRDDKIPEECSEE